MLALPAVTPAQRKVVPWVMQIAGQVLYHPSAACNGISHTFVLEQFFQCICVVYLHIVSTGTTDM